MAKGEKTVSLRAYDAVDDIVEAIEALESSGADQTEAEWEAGQLRPFPNQVKAILKKHGFGPKDW